jgi:hypothetical protein
MSRILNRIWIDIKMESRIRIGINTVPIYNIAVTVDISSFLRSQNGMHCVQYSAMLVYNIDNVHIVIFYPFTLMAPTVLLPL